MSNNSIVTFVMEKALSYNRQTMVDDIYKVMGQIPGTVSTSLRAAIPQVIRKPLEKCLAMQSK